MTYISPRSGRQFVVITAGGKAALIGGGHQPHEDDHASKGHVVAYALR